jgi:hypothetical protein
MISVYYAEGTQEGPDEEKWIVKPEVFIGGIELCRPAIPRADLEASTRALTDAGRSPQFHDLLLAVVRRRPPAAFARRAREFGGKDPVSLDKI